MLKKVVLFILALAIAAIVQIPNSTINARASSVTPVLVPGNPSCASLVPGSTELKIEPVADGTYTNGTLTVTIDVRDTASGPVFDWTANMGVDAVIVKGGPNANLYLYVPEATSDTGLHAPTNPSTGKYYGLSHISFCYDVDPATATPTPTDTPTNTPTDTPTNTPTNTPTDTPTSTPTNTPTNTPTDTPTSTPTNTPTDTPTNTPTKTPTNTPTDTPTNTPTSTPTKQLVTKTLTITPTK